MADGEEGYSAEGAGSSWDAAGDSMDERYPGLTHYGLYDTVVAREEAPPYETAG